MSMTIDSMKKLTLCLSLSLLLFVSCEEDPVDPDFDLRDEYVGSWTASEDSDFFGDQTYAIEVSKSDTSLTDIWVTNFYGLGNNTLTVMEVNDNNVFIPLQTVSGSEVSGSGQSGIDFSEVTLTYGVDDGSGVDQCTAVWVR
jgi:hypothetical protein